MELDPFLALDHPTTTPAATPVAAAAEVDPVASLLGEDHESAPAAAVVMDRSNPPKSAPVTIAARSSDVGSASEPVSIGEKC
jgi:hypothetical protein